MRTTTVIVILVIACSFSMSWALHGPLDLDIICPTEQADDSFVVQIPSKKSCSVFYKCNRGMAIMVECSAGLHYNNRIQACDFPERANCQLEATKVVGSTPVVGAVANMDSHDKELIKTVPIRPALANNANLQSDTKKIETISEPVEGAVDILQADSDEQVTDNELADDQTKIDDAADDDVYVAAADIVEEPTDKDSEDAVQNKDDFDIEGTIDQLY